MDVTVAVVEPCIEHEWVSSCCEAAVSGSGHCASCLDTTGRECGICGEEPDA